MDRRGGKPTGHFDWSPACYELVETLDEWWQGYDRFTKPQNRKARKWVEDARLALPLGQQRHADAVEMAET
jgi:hypothetical protein